MKGDEEGRERELTPRWTTNPTKNFIPNRWSLFFGGRKKDLSAEKTYKGQKRFSNETDESIANIFP